jgi:fumarate hydratase class II
MPKPERDAERVRRSAEGLRRLGIGGTAVGSGLNAHPEYHARMVRKLSESPVGIAIRQPV